MRGIGSRQWRGSWRVAIRLARRDVLRSKGRTALVAAMVGLPVMLVVTLSTLVHTNDISPREGITSTMGLTQAVITTTGDQRQPVAQGPDADSWSSSGDSTSNPPRPWTIAELDSVLGGRALPLWTGNTRLSSGTVGVSLSARELPLTDQQTRGMVHATSGRLPARAGEVAITRAVARAAGWKVGTALTDVDSKAPVTVVGTFTALGLPGGVQEVLGLPGALHDSSGDSLSNATFLLARDRPVTWSDVQQLNQKGLLVLSRAVLQDPPPKSAMTADERDVGGSDQAEKTILALVIVSIVIEVVLLAGPAFAVGVRRRRRDLALLAATGSTPRDIRRSVLAQAVLVGVGSATAGALLGLPLAAVSMPIAAHFGAGLGPFDWRWKELVLALAIGGAAALLAALAPAVQASRADVATVLAGRRGTVRSRRGWPLIGVLLIGGGGAAALTLGTRPGGETSVAGGTIVIVLGAVATTPWLVGQVGRLATRLPLPLRLAARDASRQRTRTAPAVAAIMASVIGITTLAIGFASDTKQARRDYEPRTAMGVATVNTGGTEGVQDVTATLQTMLPGRQLFTSYDVGINRDNDSSAGTTHTLVVAAPGCTVRQAADQNSTAVSAAGGEAECQTVWQNVNVGQQVAALDPAALQAFGVPLTAGDQKVLAAGGVLLAAPGALRGDHALIGVVETKVSDDSLVRVIEQKSVPAARLPVGGPRTAATAAVVMLPATAAALHLPTGPSQLAVGGSKLTKSQVDKVNQKLQLIDSELYVERGFHQPYGLVLALLALIGGLVVLVAAITSTGLAMSEARPDLATLAAIGAPPRTRRFVASAQAVVIGLLGTVLGVALGFVPGLAVTWPLTSNSFDSYSENAGGGGVDAAASTGPVIAIPWVMLAVVVVAVPLVAGLVTGMFTRSRLPMVRRLAT